MEVKVWDTFVKKGNGNVMHFDIIVPGSMTDQNMVFRYGEKYLRDSGIRNVALDAAQCQYCHIGEPTEEMINAIADHGYYILEMEEIPAELPPNPTRRQMVLHLKAHFPRYRFADLRGMSAEEVRLLLAEVREDDNR